MHISQCAQNRVAKVTDAVQEGQIVRVKVLSVDTEKKRISLSIRQAAEDEFSFDDDGRGSSRGRGRSARAGVIAEFLISPRSRRQVGYCLSPAFLLY